MRYMYIFFAIRCSQAADAKTQNTSAVRMAVPRQRDRTLLDALVTRRNSDAVRTGWKKLKGRISRVASRYPPCLALHAACRRTEVPAGTSRSSGFTTPITAVARDFGTAVAMVTRIDSKRKKSAKRSVYSRKEKVLI